MPKLTRPDCYDFGMNFLGDPEQTIIHEYVVGLENEIRSYRVDTTALSAAITETVYQNLNQVLLSLAITCPHKIKIKLHVDNIDEIVQQLQKFHEQTDA